MYENILWQKPCNRNGVQRKRQFCAPVLPILKTNGGGESIMEEPGTHFTVCLLFATWLCTTNSVDECYCKFSYTSPWKACNINIIKQLQKNVITSKHHTRVQLFRFQWKLSFAIKYTWRTQTLIIPTASFNAPRVELCPKPYHSLLIAFKRRHGICAIHITIPLLVQLRLQ